MCGNRMIKRIQSEDEHFALVRVIQRSFGTVAEQYGITEGNAPTNPAFVTIEKLKAYLAKQVDLFALFQEGEMIGCVAIEPSKNKGSVYYIERLAVVPEKRHHGYGSTLMTYAMDRIKEKGASTVSIGIINENIVLKEWYKTKGFKETECRRFNNLPFEVCFMSKEIVPKE